MHRRRGGWRGPVARNLPHGEAEWRTTLAAQPRVPGMLAEWRLAVVREVTDRQARASFLERGPDGAPIPRSLPLLLEDHAWARPVREGGALGPAPRRMQEVVSPGDVVMIEPLAATPAQGRTTPARPERAVLRQIPEVEGAVVAMEPRSGRVLAMVGGWSLERSWFNRATQAMRQPGSSFKPFVYLPALEMGIPPNQLLLDDVVEIQLPGQPVWRPGNYSGQPQGWVTMRTAMERSLNLVTVRLAQEIGMDRVADAARRFGVIDNMPPSLPWPWGRGDHSDAPGGRLRCLCQWRLPRHPHADRFCAGPARPCHLPRRHPPLRRLPRAGPEGGPPGTGGPAPAHRRSDRRVSDGQPAAGGGAARAPARGPGRG